MFKELPKTSNRKKTKVYLLGAGASTPAAPLLKEFMWQGLFHLRMGTATPDSLGKYSNFFEFLSQNYNVDPGSCNIADLSIFGQKQIDIEQILSSIDKKISKGNQGLIKAKEEAVRFVYLTLGNTLKDHSAQNCYDLFIEKKIANHDDEHNIITFNYETLLEKALLKKHLPFSYKIDVDEDKIRNFSSYYKAYRRTDNLLVLKPHGSLNWAICSKCSKVYLFWFNQYDHISEEQCNKGHRLEPVLIHPTRYKRSHGLQEIWRTANLETLWEIAKDKIATADEMTIIGLSLNPYDIEALKLIVDSIKLNKNRPDLFIADKSAKERLHALLAETPVGKSHFNKIALLDSFENYLN
jgi:NAD-dependent SIR2 family protein deacetylase